MNVKKSQKVPKAEHPIKTMPIVRQKLKNA